MTGTAVQRLQAFIDERWAVAQATRFPHVTARPVVPAGLTAREVEFALAAVAEGHDPVLVVDDQGRQRSERLRRRADGSLRGHGFFTPDEKTVLRHETVVHWAAFMRLEKEFQWPREHLIYESPALIDTDGQEVESGEAFDILVLEQPCVVPEASMSLAAARTRVAVEVKADAGKLDKMLHNMQACRAGRETRGHNQSEHKKCLAIDALRPNYFLGVAAAKTWRLFAVDDSDGRAVLGEELPSSSLDGAIRFSG